MMELQKRIDILDLWDEMPYSLDIKDFGNTVILVSESCEIRFINCIEVNIKSDILFKNKSMKFHEYRNHEYDIQDISVEPCVVKTDGEMTHNKKWVSPVPVSYTHLDSDMDTLEKSLRLDGWQQIESNIFQKETSGEVLKLSVKPINMNEFMIVYYY